MRQSNDEYQNGRLLNGYDYENQAWVVDGFYVRCGHQSECNCFGRLHAGKATFADNNCPVLKP